MSIPSQKQNKGAKERSRRQAQYKQNKPKGEEGEKREVGGGCTQEGGGVNSLTKEHPPTHRGGVWGESEGWRGPQGQGGKKSIRKRESRCKHFNGGVKKETLKRTK